jgi:hypothetical protein
MPLPVLQGTQVKSINELNLAKALDQAKVTYDYSYFVGQAGLRGSAEVDFLVYNGAHTTPVQVGGKGYYHSPKQAADDFVKELQIERYGKQYGWDKLLWVTLDESNTVEAAREWVRKNIL